MHLKQKLFILLFFVLVSLKAFSFGIVTIKGIVYSSVDNKAMNNLPVRIYPHINDTLLYYTVYTNPLGFFVLTLDRANIEGNEIIIRIENYENNMLSPLIDTININNLGSNIMSFYVKLNHHKTFYICGFVKDKQTLKPLYNRAVYIWQRKIKFFPDIVYTDTNGYFCDTIFAPEDFLYQYSVATFDDNNMQIEKKVYLGDYLITQKVNFFIKSKQNTDWYADIYYNLDSHNKRVYFSLISNKKIDSIEWAIGKRKIFNKKQFYVHLHKGSYWVRAKVYRNSKEKILQQRVVFGDIDSISGFVYASENYLSRGYVLAYKHNLSDYKFQNYTAITNGHYVFNSLFKGNYLFYAIPDLRIDTNYYPVYLPTYTGGQTIWTKTQEISVNSKNKNIDIHLHKYEGYVYGGNKLEVSIDTAFYRYSDIITVLLYDKDKTLINSRILRNTVSCSFNKLSDYQYFVRVEIPGIYCTYYLADMQKNNNVSVKFLLNETNKTISYRTTEIAKQTKKYEIKVFPNPCTNYITIECPKNISFELYNESGQKIEEKKLNAESNFIDFTNFDAGLYAIIFYKNYKIIERKIVIKK